MITCAVSRSTEGMKYSSWSTDINGCSLEGAQTFPSFPATGFLPCRFSIQSIQQKTVNIHPSINLSNFPVSTSVYSLYLRCDTGWHKNPISHHRCWGQGIDHDTAPDSRSKLLSSVGQTPVGGVGALHSGSTQCYTHYAHLDKQKESSIFQRSSNQNFP